MISNADYDLLNSALLRCGSSWNAAQAHGLLCGQLAILGADAGHGWLTQVLQNTDADDVECQECASMLDQLFLATSRQLAERQSEFEPFLPDDRAPVVERTAAMAEWCEGFLNGLVSEAKAGQLRKRLAAEPLSDIIKDMLEITRAGVEEEADEEAEAADENALIELVEYLRVATQMAYEELAELRAPADPGAAGNADLLH